MTKSKERAKRVRNAGKMVAAGGPLSRFFYSAGPDKFYKAFADKIRYGSIEIIFPNGTKRLLKGKEPGPDGILQIHHWRALQRLLIGGAVGFARSFIEGGWSSPDLSRFIEVISRNRNTLNMNIRGTRWIKWLNRLRYRMQPNTPKGSKKNIQFHYDLGNDFYTPWLDKSMTYSAAIFKPGDNSLEAAQRRKYRKLLDLLDTKPRDHILEIGCGWGGFAETAAREYGTKVTGITLSKEQLSYAKGRIQGARLEEKVSLRFQDYRDVKAQYDHVVSIEMFEAVGEEYWGTYFSKIHDALKPGGRAALQIITIDDDLFEEYRKDVDFIQAYIFPGGMLASESALRAEVAKAGLVWGGAKNYGLHYARTLKEWRTRFEAAYGAGKLPDGFDDTFRKIWTYYLSYCEGGFRGGSIDVIQLQLSKS